MKASPAQLTRDRGTVVDDDDGRSEGADFNGDDNGNRGNHDSEVDGGGSAVSGDISSRAGAGADGPAPDQPPRLDELLRTGPFHEALRAAVAAGGLSLDRIQARLARRGATVSVATLSSWQSGRFRPERPSSMAVLAALEEVLGLSREALSALLGPPRPRGRWLRPPAHRHGLAATWSGAGDVSTALRLVDTRWDDGLTRISCHNRLDLDAQGRERSMSSRQLLRAECDGPDRWITVFQLDAPGLPPSLRVQPPCRTGRVIESAQNGLLVAEVLFDRPLGRGETVIVEYTLEHQLPRPYSEFMQSTLHVPVREYVMEVRFDPRKLPETCHSFRSAEPGSRPQERLLRPDAIGAVHTVALGAGPCRLGIRWSWSDQQQPEPELKPEPEGEPQPDRIASSESGSAD